MAEDVLAESEDRRELEPERSDQRGTLIAHLIVFVSIVSALVSWRASVYSTRASDLDQAASQQLVQRQQLLAFHRGDVNEDKRLVQVYQEHVQNWKLLTTQAHHVKDTDPALAARLQGQARAELALARSLSSFFIASTPTVHDGLVTYDRSLALERLTKQDPELPALRPRETADVADSVHTDTVRLEGIAALLVLSLFCLTVAQVGRPKVRRIFWPTGVVVMTGGLFLFLLVEATA